MNNDQIVHIVDDDDAVRDALHFLMQSEDIASKTYASAEEFIENKQDVGNGCLLLDVRMPGMSGLELLDLLKTQGISVSVVFITGHGDINMAVEAMKAGAVDFIEKPFDNKLLLKSVRLCLDQSIGLNNENEKHREYEKRIALLTNRERQVMELLVEGKQNKMIARDLNISPRTVELHRARVMEKLEASSLSDVVRIALSTAEFS